MDIVRVERGTKIFYVSWYNAVKVKAVLFVILYVYKSHSFQVFLVLDN